LFVDILTHAFLGAIASIAMAEQTMRNERNTMSLYIVASSPGITDPRVIRADNAKEARESYRKLADTNPLAGDTLTTWIYLSSYDDEAEILKRYAAASQQA
jgi:hypothetical protein